MGCAGLFAQQRMNSALLNPNEFTAIICTNKQSTNASSPFLVGFNDAEGIFFDINSTIHREVRQ
jgi:hypothetical protein